MKAPYSNKTEAQIRNKYNKKILDRSISQLRAQGQLEPELPFSSGVGKPFEGLQKALFDIESLASTMNIFNSLLIETDEWRATADVDTVVPDMTKPRQPAQIGADERKIEKQYRDGRAAFLKTAAGIQMALDPVALAEHDRKERIVADALKADIPRFGTKIILEGKLLPPSGIKTVTGLTKENLMQILQMGDRILSSFLTLKQSTELIKKGLGTLDKESISKLIDSLKEFKKETARLLDKFPTKSVDDFRLHPTKGLSEKRILEMQASIRNIISRIFEGYREIFGQGQMEDLLKKRQSQVGSGLPSAQSGVDSDIPLRFT